MTKDKEIKRLRLMIKSLLKDMVESHNKTRQLINKQLEKGILAKWLRGVKQDRVDTIEG